MIKTIYKSLPFVSFYFCSLEAVYEQRKDDTRLTGCWWVLCLQIGHKRFDFSSSDLQKPNDNQGRERHKTALKEIWYAQRLSDCHGINVGALKQGGTLLC